MPVSPGVSGMQPRDSCRPWRGTLASGHKPRLGLLALQSLERNPQLSFATRMEDWTSLGQHKRHPEFPDVTQESRRNSRKTTWLPRHRKMKPFPATASQEKSHVRNWRSKRYLEPLIRPHKIPRHPGLPGGEHRGFPAPLPLSPFYPPDLDRRVDSQSEEHTSELQSPTNLVCRLLLEKKKKKKKRTKQQNEKRAESTEKKDRSKR